MGQSQTSIQLYYPLAPWISFKCGLTRIWHCICNYALNFAMILNELPFLWLEHGTWSAKHKLPTLPSLSLEVTLKKCFIWSSIFTWHDKMSRPFWSIIVQLHGTVKSADVPKLKVHSPHSVLDSRLFSPCKVPPQHCHQGAQTDNFRHCFDRTN